MKKISVFIQKLEMVLSRLIAIDKTRRVRPETVRIENNKVIIRSTEPCRRIIYKQSLHEYINNDDIDATTQADKAKLGQAIGKAIAKDLSISFGKTKIEYEDYE